MNDLTLQIYLSGVTPIYDSNKELDTPVDLWFETGYPAGRYLAGGCFVPRVPSDWWGITKPLRVAIRAGQAIVYEGVIPDLQHQLSAADVGVQLNFVGFWAWLALNRTMRKRWADNRVDHQTWYENTTANGFDLCSISRENRLRFLPKSDPWANNDAKTVQYDMPTGNIERITFDYELTGAAGEDWTVYLYDVDNESNEWSVNQSGAETSSGSVDLDSTNDYSATTKFRFRFVNTSGGAVTPASDGTTYLNITNLVVYGEDETGSSININHVAEDIISHFSAVLNSDTNYLDATNVREVEPFITQGDGYEAFGDILFRIAEFGDTSDGRYAVGLLHSEMAASPNGKPVLFTEDWPDVDAGYDYFLALDDETAALTRDFDGIFNNVTVAYRDERGWQQIEHAASGTAGATELKDQDSIDKYGQRDMSLQIGNSTADNAIDYGTRFIQKYKDPRWVVNGSIRVFDAIDGSNGELVRAARVEAGKRLKIASYGTHVISRTRYDVDSNSVEITIGAVQEPIFNESVFAVTWDDAVPGASDPQNGGGSIDSGSRFAELLGWVGLKKSNQAEYKRRKAAIMSYMKQHGVNAKKAQKALGWTYGKW